MSTLNVDKVDPSSGTALEIGTSGDTITVPSGATFVVAGTTEITGASNVQRPNANPLIINGDMQVAQRGTSTASVSTAGFYACDRWNLSLSGTQGVWTITQDTSIPTGEGFAKSTKWDCTTTDASPAVSDHIKFQQKIEAQDLQLLKYNTASAVTMTMSFWVKSNKTGTYILELYNSDATRQVSKSYTISVADTWEQKVIVIPSDTGGAINNDTGTGLSCNFFVGAGTNFTSGTLNTTWAAAVDANRAVGQVNLADSTDNYINFTGLQLVIGEYTSTTIPPFQFESFGDNLSRCSRYCQLVVEGASYFTEGSFWTGNEFQFVTTLNKPMRATPALDVASGTNYYYAYSDNAAQGFDDFLISGSSSKTAVMFYNNSDLAGSGLAAKMFWLYSSSNGKVLVTSEL